MKLSHFLATTGLVLTLMQPAHAQQQTPPGGNGDQADHFQERKADILKRMTAHLAEVQSHIACVQAANNREALRACMPEHGGERGAHHGGKPEGGEQEKGE